MLAVAISVVFVFAAALSLFAIFATIGGQWASAMELVATARNIGAERDFTVRYPREEVVLRLVTERPRQRYTAAGAVTPRTGAALAPLRAAA